MRTPDPPHTMAQAPGGPVTAHGNGGRQASHHTPTPLPVGWPPSQRSRPPSVLLRLHTYQCQAVTSRAPPHTDSAMTGLSSVQVMQIFDSTLNTWLGLARCLPSRLRFSPSQGSCDTLAYRIGTGLSTPHRACSSIPFRFEFQASSSARKSILPTPPPLSTFLIVLVAEPEGLTKRGRDAAPKTDRFRKEDTRRTLLPFDSCARPPASVVPALAVSELAPASITYIESSLNFCGAAVRRDYTITWQACSEEVGMA
ncbi:hypothetical protein D9615_000723 [Tricholomella constricta]|uniref:Uncharacterized protein n=1 Tax=Tricholomella constricta TaxID=117010 RepID=A0A8H5MBL3_9AGAR|nr:hypothetical protein D9615_000723 [Tricholomella constricta]